MALRSQTRRLSRSFAEHEGYHRRSLWLTRQSEKSRIAQGEKWRAGIHRGGYESALGSKDSASADTHRVRSWRIPMNVLIVVPWDQEFGGVASVVGNVASQLQKRGHHVWFLHPEIGRAHV